MENILSNYLAANLLPIGDDDDKLKLLEAAAAELAKQISSTPLLAYRFTLVGLDVRTASSDPVIQEAAKAVQKHWATLINKVGADPVQLYRAVILRSIEIAAAENIAITHAVSLIALNEPIIHFAPAEEGAIRALLAQFESKIVPVIEDTWVKPIQFEFPKIPNKTKKTVFDKEYLTAGIARAAGPTDKEGKPLANPNPHWTNAAPAWSYEFTSRATDAISAAIQSASKSTVEEIQSSLSENLKDLSKCFERAAIRDAKSELLWIRTSLYSPSARKGYRSLGKCSILLHAAWDTSIMVAAIAPPSVDFFLRDLVFTLVNEEVELAQLLDELGTELSSLPAAAAMIEEILPNTGRRTWLDVAVRPNNDISFEEQVGVESTYKEDSSELAVKIYREFQIRKLLSMNS